MRSTRIVAVLAALALSLTAPSLSTAAQADPVGVIAEGRVVDDYYGYNVDATVRAFKADPRSAPATAIEATAATSSGTFELSGLAEGPTWLKVTPTGAGASEKIVGPFQVSGPYYNFGEIRVRPVLGTITGTVLDEAQKPYGCAHIEVYRDGQEENTIHTEDDGKFSYTGRTGDYRFWIDSDCGDFNGFWLGGTDLETATVYPVGSGTTAIPTISISHGASITGKVSSDAIAGSPSAPVDGILVQALQYQGETDSWEVRSEERTDRTGAYRLRELQAGEYVLRFFDDRGEYAEEYYSNSSTVTDAAKVVVGSTTVTGRDVSLALKAVDTEGEMLAGVVKNKAGAGIDGVSISVFNIGQDRFSGQTSTGRKGRFSFKGLEPGDYEVSFYTEDGYIIDATTAVRVKIGTTKGADITKTLVAYGRIDGTVHVPAALLPAWDGGQVAVFDTAGDLVNSGSIDSDRTFSVRYLRPGTYKLRFGGWVERGRGYVPLIGQWWSKKYSLASATTIKVGDGGAVRGVNVALSDQLAAVSAPRITGSAKRGKTLRANVGTWNGTVGNSYSVAWFRNGKAIRGATKWSYKLVKADRRKSIQVRITATNTANAWKSGAAVSRGVKISKK